MDQSGDRQGILIVEDEPQISSYIEHCLRQFSFEIVGCSASGTEAIAIADQDLPRLAIVDIQLSGQMDGVELAEIFRDRFNIPTIFVSGAQDIATLERARNVGPAGLLKKPFLPSQLINAIYQALGSSPPARDAP
jgi:two-component system response regulator LytT